MDELDRRQRPAYVNTFHSLGLAWGAEPGADDDSAYWEQRLPQQMVSLAEALPEGERFDAFVVDEGQDFSDAWWPALLAGLKDRATGGLYVFADEGQRVFARAGRPPVDLVTIELDENLRNTKEIAQSFSSLVDHRQTIRGDSGVPVRFVACSSEEALATADGVVEDLLEQVGYEPEHIALLSTGRRHPVQVEGQRRAKTSTGGTSSTRSPSSTVTSSASRASSDRPWCWQSTGSAGAVTSGRGRSCTWVSPGPGTCSSCAGTRR